MKMQNLYKCKVSILVVTYNHELYIQEALNSIFMQEHDYDYEVVVADDCSTDGTRRIISEIQSQRPGIVTMLDSRENLGITKNYQRGFTACAGEYVAVLEGDDYWTSKRRISTIVRFLDENKGCVMAFNRFIVADMSSRRFNIQPWPLRESYQLVTISDLIRDNFIGNFSTCVYRNDIVKRLDDTLYDMKVYDWMFNIAMSQHGLIAYIPEVMSLYRQHLSGVWTQKTEVEKLDDTLASIEEYNRYLGFVYNQEFLDHSDRLNSIRSSIVNPESAPRLHRLKTIIKAYSPPILVTLLKQLVPPGMIRRH